MSWLKSAVNRAVEAGGRNNLTRTVKSYADSVVQQGSYAVTEGARLFNARMGDQSVQGIKHAVKRLEEVSVSCRGVERVQLLRGWLVALKEFGRMIEGHCDSDEKIHRASHTADESKDSLQKTSLVLYHDNDFGSGPLNFRDVFLISQAVEGITLSMILEPPNEEEVSLLMELFELCLTGGAEVHNKILSLIQRLAKAFSDYQDEVLVKREELLQFAQSAITGLKINFELSRIDADALSLWEKLDGMKGKQHSSSEGHGDLSLESTHSTIEALKQALVQIQLCSRLELVLLNKKSLTNGDSPATHSFKIEKLKVLSESLAGSIAKAEKRVEDHRLEKEEALHYRVFKTSEVSQLEKDLTIEIGALQKERDELESQLRKVNSSLIAALARLRNAKEERVHFDDASSQIVELLKTKEDELSRSIASFRAEADVVNAWITFLEDIWVIQSSQTEQKEKQVNDDMEKYEEYFLDLVIRLLSQYKVELEHSITRVKNLVETLNSSQGSEIVAGDDSKTSNRNTPRKTMEEEYLDLEARLTITFSVVDSVKRQFYDQLQGESCRKEDPWTTELFDALEKVKGEFESIKRPVLDVETPRRTARSATKTELKMSTFVPKQMIEAMRKVENVLDVEGEGGKHSRDFSAEEINDWEFDALH